MKRMLLLWAVTTLASTGTLVERSAQAQPAPPTEARDLVVFIAKEKPHLYRLVGLKPVPYGAARFYNPKSIVADARRGCFYVIDEPKLITGKVKFWRIAGDGSAEVILAIETAKAEGPFGLNVTLGLDAQGHVLVADAESGLWRLEANAKPQQVCEGQEKPLFKITATTGSPRGLLVATSYFHDVRAGSVEGWIDVTKSQGGLYLLDPGTNPPKLDCLVANQHPGQPEHDTYWRTPVQLFIDSAGRTVLVDSGSVFTRKEEIYTGARPRTQYKSQRITKSVLNGGVFVLHPDGRFEDLTFKTPNEGSGPLRRPTGAAQWSADTYIVADPEMHVDGIAGTGGLLLLKLDGAREARWPFGQRLKPLGVAILRGAGTAAEPTTTREIRLADLVGVHTAGTITRIESVSWQRKPQDGGGLLGGIGMNWEAQPREQAETKLRSLFEGARWAVAGDGTLQFSARGVAPQTQETPLVMQGKITVLQQMASATAGYKTTSMFDSQVGSIDARIEGGQPGQAVLSIVTNVFTKTERLKATFEQTMPLQGN
ncbi:MAG: hypothetical protein JW741_31390 [Sedimentisphaerales bacterium]|nr:hypothetical protein [Sedimentisphaerales bacterium]